MTLAEFQAERGLTLTALARLIGRPPSTVHGWLHGTRRPDWESLEAISRATEGAVTANDFQAALVAAGEATKRAPDQGAPQPLHKAAGDGTARRWAEENREAIEAHTRWIAEKGLPLARHRLF